MHAGDFLPVGQDNAETFRAQVFLFSQLGKNAEALLNKEMLQDKQVLTYPRNRFDKSHTSMVKPMPLRGGASLFFSFFGGCLVVFNFCFGVFCDF